MIRASPPAEDEIGVARGNNSRNGIIPGEIEDDDSILKVGERTPLIQKPPASDSEQGVPSTRTHDLESQKSHHRTVVSRVHKALTWAKGHAFVVVRRVTNPKTWDKKSIWEQGVLQPARYVPAVILGLLLNILDALSYGTPVAAATLSEWRQLIRYRYDLVPIGSANLRKPRYRWDLHVLCQLHSVPTCILSWRKCF